MSGLAALIFSSTAPGNIVSFLCMHIFCCVWSSVTNLCNKCCFFMFIFISQIIYFAVQLYRTGVPSLIALYIHPWMSMCKGLIICPLFNEFGYDHSIPLIFILCYPSCMSTDYRILCFKNILCCIMLCIAFVLDDCRPTT